MNSTLLLPDLPQQTTMGLRRIQLAAGATQEAFLQDKAVEVCLYLLVGSLDIALFWAGCCTPTMVHLHVPRRTVQEPHVNVLRIPAGCEMTLGMSLASYAADALLVTNTTPDPVRSLSPQYVLQTTCHNHHVGTGTHERWVREVLTPPGYTIHCGETLNVPGGWSSWPSHCAPDEAARYAEHEELFFVVTPGYGLMRCAGTYPDGRAAPGVIEVANGQALRTPLGSHEIVFSPGDWGYYAWFYRSFLQKQYNKYATDGVKTYVK